MPKNLAPGYVALLTAATIVVGGCGRMQTPSGPSFRETVPALDGVATASGAMHSGHAPDDKAVAICHHAEGTNPYVAIAIAAPALDAHMRHGDSRVGYPVPGSPDMKFGADCAAVPMEQVTITFNGLSSSTNESPFSEYLESGFSVTPVTAPWVIWTYYGKPAPAIVFRGTSPGASSTGEVRIAAAGAPFTFKAIDLYSSVTPIPFVITGRLGATTVFVMSGTLPNTFGMFVTVPTTHPGEVIDTLSVQLTNPASACCSNPMGLDNVVLTR